MNNCSLCFINDTMIRSLAVLLVTLLVATNGFAQYSITVKKSERKLILSKDGQEVRTYPIALGSAPRATN